MIDQFDKLGEVLTRWVHQTTHTNNLTMLIKEWLQDNQTTIERFLKSKDFSDALKTTMPKVFSVVSQTATVLMSIVASMITLLYMFFILLDYETLTANWVRIFPKKNRPFWSALMKDVERELNNYIRGQGMVALHGHHVLHRLHHHRFPDGDRSGHSDWHHGPGTISSYLCPHSYGIPGNAQGGRYGTELLGSLRTGGIGILRGAGDYGYGGYAEDYGQGDGPEPSHPAPESFDMGCSAGLPGADCCPSAHHPSHSLLAAVCNERKAAI